MAAYVETEVIKMLAKLTSLTEIGTPEIIEDVLGVSLPKELPVISRKSDNHKEYFTIRFSGRKELPLDCSVRVMLQYRSENHDIPRAGECFLILSLNEKKLVTNFDNIENWMGRPADRSIFTIPVVQASWNLQSPSALSQLTCTYIEDSKVVTSFSLTYTFSN